MVTNLIQNLIDWLKLAIHNINTTLIALSEYRSQHQINEKGFWN